jgi:protease I
MNRPSPSCAPSSRLDKPIAAICHGPWTLIDAGGVQGPQDDLVAFAARRPAAMRAPSWSDTEVVVDRDLVTSRKPDDLPAFNREMTRMFELAYEAAMH